MNDVIVNITDQARPTTKAGFGKPLILGVTEVITGAKDSYKEYADIDAVVLDYAITTDEYKAAKAMFDQEPRPEKVAIFNVTRSEPAALPADMSDALDDILEANHNDWYWLLLTSRDTDDIEEVAEWADTNKKFLVICFHSATLADITALATAIESDKNAIFAHKQMSEFMDSALVGKLAPKPVGSYTAKFKTLVGISDAGYNAAEISTLHTANVNTYIKKSGVLQTTEGKTTDGSYIDLTIAKDWLRMELHAEVMKVMLSNDKISYDETGVAVVVGAVTAVMKRAVSQGIIAKDGSGNGKFVVYEPKLSNISEENRSKRILPDINWTATVAGAVHEAIVNGVVQV